MNAILRTASITALAATLASCGSGSTGSQTAEVSVRPTTFNVERCINQVIPGTGGETVAQAVIPDTVTLNLAAAPGFPNGRLLTDPVIDRTLAVIFLDMTKVSPNALANLPVNPAANDVPFRSTFPYLAAAQDSPPLSGTGGTNFNFRTDPVSAYVRVDRMGMPAIATALISSTNKNSYNDGDPVADAAGTFTLAIGAQLTTLTNALTDDFAALGLATCATKI